MIIIPKTINDVIHLRYDLIRIYNIPEFDEELKQFVMDELDKIINGTNKLKPFVELQEKISIGMDVDIPNSWQMAARNKQHHKME